MTNPDHARFAEWDAAYVLGALSPAERREFEDHLDDCDRCRSAVTELSALPGLLGRIDDARAFALLEDEGSPSEPVDEPVSTVATVTRIRDLERRRKIRRTLTSIIGLASAAALASVLTIVVPQLIHRPLLANSVVFLAPVGGAASAPIDANVAMTTVGWGTKLEMECRYASPGSSETDESWGSITYSLWVVDDDGTQTAVSSWKSSPGTDIRIDAGTATDISDIAKLELRSADGLQIFLSGEVGQH